MSSDPNSTTDHKHSPKRDQLSRNGRKSSLPIPSSAGFLDETLEFIKTGSAPREDPPSFIDDPRITKPRISLEGGRLKSSLLEEISEDAPCVAPSSSVPSVSTRKSRKDRYGSFAENEMVYNITVGSVATSGSDHMDELSEEVENISPFVQGKCSQACNNSHDFVVPQHDQEAVANMADQFKKFFSKRSSLGESTFSEEDKAWKPFDSWASGVDIPKTFTQPPQPVLTFNPGTEIVAQEEEFWAIRVFKPMDKLDTRLSALVENSGHTFVTVACSLSTKASELCKILSKKFSSSKDLERFRLFVIHAGTERLLAHEDRPVAMLKNWLEVIGYREGDQLQKIAREDHSYLCRFVFHEFPPAPPSSDELEKGTHPRITTRSAFLAELNLSVIPVAVFRNAQSLEFMDLSRNTLLDLPEDLFEDLVSLKLLRLIGNLMTSVPKAIVRTQMLTHLDLSSNNLTGHCISILKECTKLTHLNLSCNQIDHFPYGLSSLTKIRALDLSSNYISDFPPAILAMTDIKELNLAFNLLTSIPDEIERLVQLRSLSLTGNKVHYIPHSICELVHLKQLDIRGNLMEDLGGIAWIASAFEIYLSYNNMIKLDTSAWNSATVVLASHNQLSSISFMQRMTFLKTIDLTVNKLITLPDNLFEFTPALQSLNLARNQLTALPSSLNQLQCIESINIADNEISELNIDFSVLPKLIHVDAHGNNLKILPVSIWKAPALKYLNFSSNFITGFPEPGFHFTSQPLCEVLEELYIAENHLSDAAMEDIYMLTKLSVLNIGYNQIFDLGEDIGNLKNLTDLYVSGNSISRIPETIEQLQNLKRFFINGNKLSNIPSEVAKITSLMAFDVSSNNLKFNVANWPYDWNWNFNTELQYLDMANNKRFDLMPTQPGNASEKFKDLTSFKSLQKLRLLNLKGVKPSANFPEETITLRVRNTVHDDVIRVATSDFCGRDPVFDKFDTCQKNFFDQENDFLVGFFDGQGSDVVSYYLKDSLNEAITYEVQRLRSEEDIPAALRRGFLACNRDLSMQPTQILSGATATVAYFMDNKLYVANVGDSMAIISRDGQALVATEKHHGWNRLEQSRIRNLGGYISTDGLVERELQITRGFGYHHLLPFINVNPFIKSFEIGPHEEFVIMASQSFWRYVRYQVAVDIARAYRDHPEVAAQRLRDTALAYGCTGSMTVVFICLKNVGASISRTEVTQEQIIERRRRIFRGSVEDRTLARLAAEIPPPKPPCAIVFTDIRESTRLWEKDPNAMRAANKIHNQIMRRLLRHHRGYEVKNEGDAFMVVFETILDATKWCKNVQQQLLEAEWPQEILNSPICAPVYDPDGNLLYRGISVRMGIHFGMAINEQDIVTRRMDYFGVEVITASRICDAALGGQIIVTSAIYNMAQEAAKSSGEELDMAFFEIGATKLKGIENFEVVYAAYPASLSKRFTQQQYSLSQPARL